MQIANHDDANHTMANHHHLESCSIKAAVTIHHRNLRAFAIEIYKVMQGLSSPFNVFMSRQCNDNLC